MKKEFSESEIRTAKDVHLFEGNTLYVVDSDYEVYGFYRYGGEWYHKANFWDYFESSSMLSCFSSISREDAAKLYHSWCELLETVNSRLDKAICFATERHAGQTRKGTDIPYILHPLEVMQILFSMRADTELLIAGVLHDTVEDTDITLDEIRALFGEDVADLVAANSEDKSKTWEERKQHTIDMLPGAPLRVKQLILADKLANLRSIARDYRLLGKDLWKRFNAPATKQAWYYSRVNNALSSVQYSACADTYWEFTALYKDVFVQYYLDDRSNILHQICLSGEHYCLNKACPDQWETYEEWLAEKISDSLETFISGTETARQFHQIHFSTEEMTNISRKQAEHMEDMWRSCDVK